jgi:PadR family transcriptional regulator, regulatory protein PadR
MGFRLTVPTLRLLHVLLENPEADHYGYELMRQAKLDSGTLYPILIRLEREGWLTSIWENIDESAEGRRKRRIYKVTGLGQHFAKRELEQFNVSRKVVTSNA